MFRQSSGTRLMPDLPASLPTFGARQVADASPNGHVEFGQVDVRPRMVAGNGGA
jgi:hypothetical protein